MKLGMSQGLSQLTVNFCAQYTPRQSHTKFSFGLGNFVVGC